MTDTGMWETISLFQMKKHIPEDVPDRSGSL